MLPLHIVVLLAGIQGLSEALPVSRSGHDIVAWIWLEPGPNAASLETFLHLATASALIVATRRRIAAAAGAGLLAITRPRLFRSSAPAHDAAVMLMAFGASLLTTAVVEHFAAPWMSTPVTTGFGLLLTSMLLGTTTLVPALPANELHHDEPSIPFALFLGIALGLAALPGGSYIGAVLVMSSWMGLKKDLALDLAMFLTATALLEKCIHSFLFHSILPDISLPLLMMAFVTAFLGTTVAIRATRFLLERRALSLVAFWTFPLGLAILAYSRAFSEGLSLATFTRPG